MEYTVVLHKAEEGGYWAEVPALEGCFSQGETVEESMVNIKEAIKSHIVALKEEGQRLPVDQLMIVSHVAV
ncbi:MAG: type II toxin-antitoxin system HicB family antitoxin [Nitrososphaerota archaeon]|nr:type II toxin-antitoxin system HicB family antitoxin [Nitrososphaerota archaeon]